MDTAIFERCCAAWTFRQRVDHATVEALLRVHWPGRITRVDSLRDLALEARAAWAARAARDCSWLCLTALTGNRSAQLYLELLEAGCWILQYGLDGSVLWVPIPRMVTQDGRCHCTTGPAFVLPAHEEYFLHGVLVPREVVTTPADQLDLRRWVAQETNAEVRREVVRKVGIERVYQQLGATVVECGTDHAGQPCELVDLNLGDGRRRPYIKLRNPSIGVYHLEGVHPECRTLDAAFKFRNGTAEAPAWLR